MKNNTNNTNTNANTLINAQVLADTSYFLKPYDYFDSTLVRMKALTAEVITRDNISAEAESRYVNVYGRSAESAYFARENALSIEWARRQAKAKTELIKLLCFVNSKCRETLCYMHERLGHLLLIPEDERSNVERKQIKELRTILNKYDITDSTTLNFIKVFLDEENVIDVAEEISVAFIILEFYNRLRNLLRVPEDERSDVERKEIKKLKKILSKYDITDTTTLNFIKVFLDKENVIDFIEEISAAFPTFKF